MHIHQQVVQQYFCHANYNIKNILEIIWELKIENSNIKKLTTKKIQKFKNRKFEILKN